MDEHSIDSNFGLIGSYMADVYHVLQDNYKRAQSVTGLSTGYDEIDKMLHGLQRGDLVVVASHSSEDNTSWLINLANNIATCDNTSNSVACLTLGMSNIDLGMRMLSVESRVDISSMYSGTLNSDDWRMLASASGILAEAKIFVDEEHSTSVSRLRAKCMQIKDTMEALDVVLIDCLQLLGDSCSAVGRNQHLLGVLSELKSLAKELDVPVVVTSQLNNQLENRANKRPLLSDFCEPSMIEGHADVVMFIHRDPEWVDVGCHKGKAEIIIAKNKHGEVGSVELSFLEKYLSFESLNKC